MPMIDVLAQANAKGKTMSAKKLERSAAELFLESALKDGRATRQELSLRSIVIDTALQSRVATDPEHVKHLASLENSGVELRPVVVFRDPEPPYRTLLADGFHRCGARKARRQATVWAFVIEGTWIDAVRYSASANIENSKPATLADRRKALEMILGQPEFHSLDDHAIGTMCGLWARTVTNNRSKIMTRLGFPPPPPKPRKTNKRKRSIEPGQGACMPPGRHVKITTIYENIKDGRSPARCWADRLLKELSPAEIAELITLLQAAGSGPDGGPAQPPPA
jgi:hypothetical protein